MGHRLVGGAILAISVFAVGSVEAEELKSGPQVGSFMPVPLHALNVTGPRTDKKC